MVFQFLYRGTLVRRSKLDEWIVLSDVTPDSIVRALRIFRANPRCGGVYLHRRTGFAIRFIGSLRPPVVFSIQHFQLMNTKQCVRTFCGACMIGLGYGLIPYNPGTSLPAESDGFSLRRLLRACDVGATKATYGLVAAGNRLPGESFR